VLETLFGFAGRDAAPDFQPPRVGEVRASQADIQKARSVLGFDPTVDSTTGLRRTFDYFASDESLLPRVEERRAWSALS
jgi:nucleoside-diphosphate-sugar epimerase